jgi:ABC-type branched-subunit amino acid transport system ATPase component
LIIESGRKVLQDEPAKVVNDPRVIECYLGGANADRE